MSGKRIAIVGSQSTALSLAVAALESMPGSTCYSGPMPSFMDDAILVLPERRERDPEPQLYANRKERRAHQPRKKRKFK